MLADLAAIAPGVPVVAEESVAAGEVPVIAERFFLVDPLDGTREFVSHRDEFTVNIALIEAASRCWAWCSRRRVASFTGVTSRPARPGTSTPTPTAPCRRWATPSRRAWRRPAASPRWRRVRIARPRPMLSSLTTRWPNSARSAPRSSSAWWRLARADLYPRIGTTMEWDTAAGHAVLVAAGGRVTGLAGEPFRYGKPGFRNGNFVALGTPVVVSHDSAYAPTTHGWSPCRRSGAAPSSPANTWSRCSPPMMGSFARYVVAWSRCWSAAFALEGGSAPADAPAMARHLRAGLARRVRLQPVLHGLRSSACRRAARR